MENYAKVKLIGELNLLSGLHIGGSDAFAAIGSVDAPIIKDTLTGLPLIPGSSIKGKLRTLLAKTYNRSVSSKPDHDDPRITRLFGATTGGGEDGKGIIRGRLLFRDMVLANKDELDSLGVDSYTEVKFENTIGRIDGMANPRQIERAIRGSKFNFELIYELNDRTEVLEDMKTIRNGLKLLETDYLGGSGSRGYGKVAIKNLRAEIVFGDYDISEINNILEG